MKGLEAHKTATMIERGSAHHAKTFRLWKVVVQAFDPPKLFFNHDPVEVLPAKICSACCDMMIGNHLWIAGTITSECH